MLHVRQSSFAHVGFFVALTAAASICLSGCGIGSVSPGRAPGSNVTGAAVMSGTLLGGNNPISGAALTLYSTTSGGYGATANVIATTISGTDGSFSFTLPTTGVACPAGEFAYVASYGGNTGALSENKNTLLMAPGGACGTLYSSTSSTVGSTTTYTNIYLGGKITMNELTTAVSAYALGSFMSVTNAGVVNIGAPANNHSTASASTPSAAGLAHAFANALAIINTTTGMPNATTTHGAIIPDGEIFLLGDVLQACVNSTGVTGTNSATSNDGSSCGKLFSFVTPPQSGAAVPNNTLQAAVDLAKYPNPQVNTWNTGCTATGAGNTTTATACLFNLASATGAYSGALSKAPPDWALALVYPSGTGAQTTSCTGTCPGLTYPYYVALDYEDNVYVLNYSALTTTYTNIMGFEYDGTPLFSSPEDATDLAIATIGTDTAGHVFGANTAASGSSDLLKVYNAGTGAVAATVTAGLGAMSANVLADPLNNIYISSAQASINLRKATYTGPSATPTYSVATLTSAAPAAPVLQIGFDPSLDIYLLSSTPDAYLLPNTGTFAAPAYAANGLATATTASVTGTAASTSAYGIAATSAGNALVVTSTGVTPITETGSGSSSAISAGSASTIPAVNTNLGNRGAWVDGLNFLFSPDGANGGAVSGVSVYDSTDKIALGTYKGCYVISGACGTTAGSVPMYSPRGAAIDSAGDVWVVSGSSANLTELIGVAAPTWPGLSMGKFGRPQ